MTTRIVLSAQPLPCRQERKGIRATEKESSGQVKRCIGCNNALLLPTAPKYWGIIISMLFFLIVEYFRRKIFSGILI